MEYTFLHLLKDKHALVCAPINTLRWLRGVVRVGRDESFLGILFSFDCIRGIHGEDPERGTVEGSLLRTLGRLCFSDHPRYRTENVLFIGFLASFLALCFYKKGCPGTDAQICPDSAVRMGRAW